MVGERAPDAERTFAVATEGAELRERIWVAFTAVVADTRAHNVLRIVRGVSEVTYA